MPVAHDQTTDRRRRHHDDPTTQITVNIDLVTLRETDTYCVEHRTTRSGLIRLALRAYLRAEQGSD